MTKVFIDGSAGTTGLRIHERLADRSDLELLILPDAVRKDENARREMLHTADHFLWEQDLLMKAAMLFLDMPVDR